MIAALRNLMGRHQEPAPAASVPPGQRVYAVGDIHGRLDLFMQLIEAIDTDDALRAEADTTVVLLGDLVDRGPDSAGVIAAARRWGEIRPVVCLAGNHEEMFLRAYSDSSDIARFLKYGGFETLLSYGIWPDALRLADDDAVQALMRAAVPAGDLDFLRGLPDSAVIGDYLFVHAGIRPGEPLDSQHSDDLRWIREPFLSHREHHDHIVVHGHTITDEPDIRPNRIGIDTGAYHTDRLTALALEGTARWLIQADGGGRPTSRPI